MYTSRWGCHRLLDYTDKNTSITFLLQWKTEGQFPPHAELLQFLFACLFSFVSYCFVFLFSFFIDLMFLLTKEIMWCYFSVCFVVYQRTSVRYLIFLPKLKCTRKFEVLGCFFFQNPLPLRLNRYWNACFYVPLQLEGHQPLFTQGSFNNVNFHKRISVKDVVLLWTMIIYPHLASKFESREIFRTQGILEFSNSNCSVLTLVFRYNKGGTWHYRSRERVYRSWSNRAVAS